MDLLHVTNRAKSMNFIRRLNGEIFFLQDRKSFQIWKFIRVMEGGNEMQNFTLICPNLCLLGQKKKKQGYGVRISL